MILKFKIASVAALQRLAGELAATILPQSSAPLIIYLQGELGAGKTTFVRGFLRHLGYQGSVKSPTFNLFETYHVAGKNICHFDLYRIIAQEELEFLGIRDYFTTNSICLIEWPERAKEILPEPDLVVSIGFLSEQKYTRKVEITAGSSVGTSMLQQID